MGEVTAHMPGSGRMSSGGPRNKAANGRFASRFPMRGSYAALDLGTNNCRLLIARPDGEHFAVVDAFSRIVRLGEGLATTGKLSDVAMDRAVAALAVCADKLRRRNVIVARSVATEACRRASNGPSFVNRVERETGIKLDIISAQEEARLAVLGCHHLLESANEPAIIFDIGGGSTEIVIIDDRGGIPEILDWLSIPWGVVSLTEAMSAEQPTAPERILAYARMREQVKEAMANFARRSQSFAPIMSRMMGTSGTVTTLASVHLQLPSYDRKQVDGLQIRAAELRQICSGLAEADLQSRSQLPCIGSERADLVVAGCAILEAIFDLWPVEHVRIADRGIREGILRQLIASGGRA